MSKTDAINDISSKIADSAKTARDLTILANDYIAAGQWTMARQIHEYRDAALARSERLSRLRDKRLCRPQR
jgi:hypothetical protein